ncbi:hypothetical protein [Paraburkholderia fungorum]|uniref:hypothetical protein n=1 Tax=Paraburkholderia fungorum TaxID=134537 RepID=UPI001C1EABCF|nr:hypothetical protein [Paraburkholderia fungorum]MBU7440903.1 hypothetical protein [Paraburkholderia fungorum]
MTLTRERAALVHRLIDESGHAVATFDLSKLDVSHVIAEAFLRAHDAEYGHTAIETQKQTLRCIRKLIVCLQQSNLAYQLPLPSSIAGLFHDWLSKSGLGGSTSQSHQNTAFTILRWCRRNASEIISDSTYIGSASFYRNEPKKKSSVDGDTIRLLLTRCYEEIEKIELRLEFGKRLISGDYEQTDKNRLLASTLIDLIRIGKGSIPGQKIIYHSKLALAARVNACGGLQYIKSLMYLMTGDVFPFYLAIVTQTGGNPMAIRLMGVDCIKPHPLRDDLELLCWIKERAKSEQRQDFPIGKAWSAPNIVRRLLKLNSNLRLEGRFNVRDRLFLARGMRRDEPLIPSVQSLHNYLNDFIARHELKNFDFDNMRITVATALHKKTTSIDVPRNRLNHKSSKTTSRYTSIHEFPLEWYKKISEFQGILVSRDGIAKMSDKRQGYDELQKKSTETVFGFGCQDPFAGADGITPKGTRCANFTWCSTCTGSVVPLDDPVVISKILSAKAALEAAHQNALMHGWLSRFEAVYGDTLKIISEDILPFVSPLVLEKAKNLMDISGVPILE